MNAPLIAQAPTPESQLLTIEQARRRLNVSRSTIQRMMAEKQFRVVRFSTTCVRVDIADLERYISRCKLAGGSIGRGSSRPKGPQNGISRLDMRNNSEAFE